MHHKRFTGFKLRQKKKERSCYIIIIFTLWVKQWLNIKLVIHWTSIGVGLLHVYSIACHCLYSAAVIVSIPQLSLSLSTAVNVSFHICQNNNSSTQWIYTPKLLIWICCWHKSLLNNSVSIIYSIIHINDNSIITS